MEVSFIFQKLYRDYSSIGILLNTKAIAKWWLIINGELGWILLDSHIS